jgi:starch phosphorylase
MELTLPYSQSQIAYLSMEIALDSSIPTYAGGLGVLAGDILRSAADLEVPMVGVTLLHRQGYFGQRLAADGRQTETAEEWSPEDRLEQLETAVTVEIEGQKVRIRPWRFTLTGIEDYQVPVFLLDTDLESNSEFHRSLTDRLYGGDARYRLCEDSATTVTRSTT